MTEPQGTILITGANGGLGSAIVSHILSSAQLASGNHGVYAVRNPQRADTVSKILKSAAKTSKPKGSGSGQHRYDLMSLDLANLDSVRRFAAEVREKVDRGAIPRIRALVLCAGWQEWAEQTWTAGAEAERFDMAFASNYLGHFLLTLLLLGCMDNEKGRIVIVGSWSHDTQDPRNNVGMVAGSYTSEPYRSIFRTDPWNGEDIARGRWSTAVEHPDDKIAGFRRYGASKLCEIMMFRELSRRIADDPALCRIDVVGLDPGGMLSGLTMRTYGPIARVVSQTVFPPLIRAFQVFKPNGIMRTQSKSGNDVVRACFAAPKELGLKNGEKLNGTYFDGSELGDIGMEAKDTVKTGRLWTDTIQWTNLRDGDTVLRHWN